VNEFSSNSGSSISANRLRFLQILFFSVILICAGRLFTLQVIMGGSYKKKARNVTQSLTEIPAQRGEIFDRNFNLPLVLNIDSFAIDIIPAEIPAEMRDTVFQKLAAAIPMPIEDIRKKISPKNYHFYKPIEIKNQIPYETVASIAERIDEFPGVTWHDKPIRNYIETNSFSHIIGYVGDITQEELQVLFNKGYIAGDIIGKTGIEKEYDSFLRGKNGSKYRIVDVKGKTIDSDSVILDEPEMGKNLVLTIDRNIQILCEKALGERMGAIVAIRPATGEVLAMVSYPYYSPNLLSGESMSREYAKLAEDKNRPLINRAIGSMYPPASTFKVVMSTAILEEKAIPPEKTIFCEGFIDYGDRIFKCHLHSGHGRVNLQQALAQSCDVYFYTAGKDYLGIDSIIHYARDEFNFGFPTGIDLPGEISGFIPTPQWKERKLHEKWLGGDTVNTSIGQGFTQVTPIQMANMVAMVVNEGVIYKPHLLKEVRDAGSGALVKRIDPELLKKSSVSADTFKTVKNNMRSVITDGTAQFPVNIKAVQIAGKTGTAQVGLNDRWDSWLASYAPYNYKSPEEVIAIAVIVDHTNDWEWWAPYATAIIYQGIYGDQSYEEAMKTLGFPSQNKQQVKRE
jgi:penicillin-binding protein 2